MAWHGMALAAMPWLTVTKSIRIPSHEEELGRFSLCFISLPRSDETTCVAINFRLPHGLRGVARAGTGAGRAPSPGPDARRPTGHWA